jgi:AraC-like DNA-binding protein
MDTATLCEPITLDPANSVRVERVLRPSGSPPPTPFAHFHEPAELIWFERAEGEVVTETGALPIADATLLFLPAMAIHDFRLRGGATAWVLVHLDPALAPWHLWTPQAHRPEPEAKDRLKMAFDWLADLAAQPGRSADVLTLAGLILRELPESAPTNNRVRGASLALHRLRPALDLVSQAAERAVTIEDAAARCHLSPAYFSRAFSSQFGIGFAEYARQYRLRAAARSLTTSGARISEIAYRNGFLNPSHFAAAFQKRYGVSPTQFRRMHQQRG